MYVASQGIEPYPYVLQTYAQTTYARKPRLIQWAAEDSNLSREDLIYSQAAVSKTTFATQFLYLVMVMLHRLLHVKQLRFYYANEAIFVPPEGNAPSSRY